MIHCYLNYLVLNIENEEVKNSKEYKALMEFENNSDLINADINHHTFMMEINELMANCVYDWAIDNGINITKDYCQVLFLCGLSETSKFRKFIEKSGKIIKISRK
jgi:hypothetical protein